MNYNANKNLKAWVFDFDGVLVDSYFCLPLVYGHIAQYTGLEKILEKKFVERALKYEDEQDAVENYDRKSWWHKLFREFRVNIDEKRLDELLQIYWKERSKESRIIEGTIKILERLRNGGATVILLAGSDGLPGGKRLRVEKSGLIRFLDDIFIVGEDLRNRVDGIKLIMEKYGIFPKQIAFIDDKPAPINEINKNFKDITAIKVKFEGILKSAWEKEKCTQAYEIKNINELSGIIDLI